MPPLFLAHLRLALLASSGRTQVVTRGFFNSAEVKTFVQCEQRHSPGAA